jgi:hypothetical protein
VTLGDEFGWGIQTLDGEYGPAQVTISEFNAPTPEPGTMFLMGSGLASMLGYGWRKRKQQVS